MQMTEKERWPTTGSEETFCALSAEGMIKAGFNIDSCTMAEFEAYQDQCNEEDVESDPDLGPTHFNCCHAPKDQGHMFGCPHNPENKGGVDERA